MNLIIPSMCLLSRQQHRCHRDGSNDTRSGITLSVTTVPANFSDHTLPRSTALRQLIPHPLPQGRDNTNTGPELVLGISRNRQFGAHVFAFTAVAAQCSTARSGPPSIDHHRRPCGSPGCGQFDTAFADLIPQQCSALGHELEPDDLPATASMARLHCHYPNRGTFGRPAACVPELAGSCIRVSTAILVLGHHLNSSYLSYWTAGDPSIEAKVL